jgi:hypothetical protein
MMGSNNEALVGTWRLVSCFMGDVETNEQKLVWGKHPNGFIVMTSECRWIVIQTAEGRTAPKTDEDRAAASRSMLAYSGKYRTEGNKIVINADIAADESWNRKEQARYFKIEGDQLHIEAAPQRYANFGDRLMRAILIWVRD